MSDYLGKQFGNYRLVELLGEGTFAQVYLGEHVHLGSQAAIKVLTTKLTNEGIAQFRDEARIIINLEHTNIVRVLDFDLQGRIPFIVTNYAPGGSLRKLHPFGSRLALPKIVTYVKQIASALQYAHDRKLIHRDVKPDNMLIGRNNEVLLSDFGIAVIAHSTRSLSTEQFVSGTFYYMAPEQIQGKPRIASDQYALGIVVYEWLSGMPPFIGTATEIGMQHLLIPPPSLREKVASIPMEVEQVVLKALAKDPLHRYNSVAEFAEDLERTNKKVIEKQQDKNQRNFQRPVSPIPLSPQKVDIYEVQPAKTDARLRKRAVSRREFLVGISVAGVAVLGLGGYKLLSYFNHLPSKNLETLYQEDGSDNWKAWKRTPAWNETNGMLTHNEDNGNLDASTILAPTQITATVDYAVEANIQWGGEGGVVGIRVRGSIDNQNGDNNYRGYWATIGGYSYFGATYALIQNDDPSFSGSILASAQFDPAEDWHTYRVETKGDTIRFFVDGNFIIEANNSEFPSGGQVGITSDSKFKISSFKVYAI